MKNPSKDLKIEEDGGIPPSRVIRGGSQELIPSIVGVSYLGTKVSPHFRYANTIGFRIVRNNNEKSK
jgi:hypothetical protein